MLNIHTIFLRRLAVVFLALFLVLGASLYFWVKDIYIDQARIDLSHNIDIFSMNFHDMDQLDKSIRYIKKQTNIRTTIIDNNGTVIADSDGDKNHMGNHTNRSEIVSSRYREYGYAIRHSNTLGTELLYVAKRVFVGKNIYYVRMARELNEIINAFIILSLKIASLFLVFAFFTLWLMVNVSKNITKETDNVLNFLRDMSKRNRSTVIKSSYSSEFYAITELLTETSAKLSKRQKQKSKYTAKLKLSNRQKDDIISAISHEFKNPISVISGYSQTLIDDKDINQNIRDKFLGKIYNNSIKLSDMIDRLRLSIKLDDSKHNSSFKQCDIVRVSNNICEDMKSYYPGREIIFTAPKSIIITCDETLISIAIVNLIENAIKYSEDEVKVTVGSSSIRVEDCGIGISEKDLPKIIKKFYRVSSNNWNNSLGIGLSIVSSILSIHDFKLEIESQENKGSMFRIVF